MLCDFFSLMQYNGFVEGREYSETWGKCYSFFSYTLSILNGSSLVV